MDTRGFNLKLNKIKQERHIADSPNYVDGRSILTSDPEMLLSLYAGVGTPINVDGAWFNKERFTHNDFIGIWKSPDGKISKKTRNGIIHYSKENGMHIVPAQP